jgi:hypothetical protein
VSRLRREFLKDASNKTFYKAFQDNGVYNPVETYTPKNFPDEKFDDEDENGNTPDPDAKDEITEDDVNEETGFSETPAALTELPTSSTNVSRPRTVAAGYEPNEKRPDRGKMTVMFRDGTLYNYYNVNPGEWETFKSSISKGRPFLNKQNQYQGADGIFIGKPRGEADLSGVDKNVLADIYRIARSTQYRYAYHGRVPKKRQGAAYTTPVAIRHGKNNATANKPRKP